MADHIQHGTYKGYQQCRKRAFWGACPECKEALRLYMREWRKKSPEKNKALVEDQYLRDKALRILAKKHSSELKNILAELKKQKEWDERNE